MNNQALWTTYNPVEEEIKRNLAYLKNNSFFGWQGLSMSLAECRMLGGDAKKNELHRILIKTRRLRRQCEQS